MAIADIVAHLPTNTAGVGQTLNAFCDNALLPIEIFFQITIIRVPCVRFSQIVRRAGKNEVKASFEDFGVIEKLFAVAIEDIVSVQGRGKLSVPSGSIRQSAANTGQSQKGTLRAHCAPLGAAKQPGGHSPSR